jgi:excisionase family DNA binding protein
VRTDPEELVAGLLEIATLLGEVYTPEKCGVWMWAPQRQFDDSTAWSMIARGRVDEVIAAAEQLRDGQNPDVKPKREPLDRKTYTVEEAADILGVSRSFAYEAVKRGDIPSMRIGRRWLVPKSAIDEWLEGKWPRGEGDE